jgi:hypothetical protein
MSKLLPEHFDANEWFVLFTFCVLVSTLFMLPRRFPRSVSIVFSCIGLGISQYADYILGVPPIDLYDADDTQFSELSDFFLYYLYAPFAYLFLYFFDKWKLRGLLISLYVLLCSAAGAGFEALAVYFHVFKYKGWSIGYSFVFYLFVQSVDVLLYYLIKKKYNQTKRASGPEWT